MRHWYSGVEAEPSSLLGEGEGNLGGVRVGLGHRFAAAVGCGCGRRLVTGSCVIRETTQPGCWWSTLGVSLSIYQCVYYYQLFVRSFVRSFVGAVLLLYSRLLRPPSQRAAPAPCATARAPSQACALSVRPWYARLPCPKAVRVPGGHDLCCWIRYTSKTAACATSDKGGDLALSGGVAGSAGE